MQSHAPFPFQENIPLRLPCWWTLKIQIDHSYSQVYGQFVTVWFMKTLNDTSKRHKSIELASFCTTVIPCILNPQSWRWYHRSYLQGTFWSPTLNAAWCRPHSDRPCCWQITSPQVSQWSLCPCRGCTETGHPFVAELRFCHGCPNHAAQACWLRPRPVCGSLSRRSTRTWSNEVRSCCQESQWVLMGHPTKLSKLLEWVQLIVSYTCLQRKLRRAWHLPF